MNRIAAEQLIEESAAASLGITRDKFVLTYAGFVVVGVAMIFLGGVQSERSTAEPDVSRAAPTEWLGCDIKS